MAQCLALMAVTVTSHAETTSSQESTGRSRRCGAYVPRSQRHVHAVDTRSRMSRQTVAVDVRVDAVPVDANVLYAGKDERCQLIRVQFHQVLQLQTTKSVRMDWL